METRSRKRAEASSTTSSSTTSGPTTRSHSSTSNNNSNKRPRLSAPPTAPTTTSAPATRSRQSRGITMDPDSSSSRHSRRGKVAASSSSAAAGGSGDGSDKGKEKESNNNNNHGNSGLGLNMDAAVAAAAMEDDDNDSEGGVGILHHNLTSASSALQGLLRKLGAGLDDLLPSSAMGSASSSHQSGRLKKILSGLRADGEEGKQVEALTQLCEMLSIGTEESLSTFSVDSFVPVLVGLLNHESNPDIMLLAARALTHLCDVLPSSCAAVVHYGAVTCFVARLLTIEYMDLAEQVGSGFILMVYAVCLTCMILHYGDCFV